MHNWYRRIKFSSFIKTASITFFLPDSFKISRPKKLLNLSTDFLQFVYENNFEGIAPHSGHIEPDLNDFDDYTGKMYVSSFYNTVPKPNIDSEQYNQTKRDFYNTMSDLHNDPDNNKLKAKLKRLQDEVDTMEHTVENSLEDYDKAIRSWIEDKKTEGYEFKYDGIDSSQADENSVEYLTIEVIENPSKNYFDPPEVNMSNINAGSILRLLQLPQEPSGSVRADDLKLRIEQTSRDEMQSETQPSGWLPPPEDKDQKLKNQGGDDFLSVGDFLGVDNDKKNPWDPPDNIEVHEEKPEGSNFYMQGRSEEYIDGRLQSLYNLADFAIQNGFEYIGWG